ncbi:MAG: hypothetical protein EWM73_01297 [Nitrospira sp.]|nr:MAG: hypothetical protein EWM73_01297 [Nitrospira sp.]
MKKISVALMPNTPNLSVNGPRKSDAFGRNTVAGTVFLSMAWVMGFSFIGR